MSDSKTRKARLTLAGLGILTVGVLVGGGVTAAMVLGDDSSGGRPSPKPTATPSNPSSSQQSEMTPDKARKLELQVPTGQKDGLSTGFSDGPVGAISTAVYFWEEYAFLDDQKARQQLEAIVSPDADGYVDEQISEVRKLRENTGLPPSGGTPAGVTFSTTVNAVRPTSLDKTGKVVQIWINYDRYATNTDGSPDDEPLKDQTIDLILKQQDGTWKLTNEPEYRKKRSFARAYFPDSHVSWQDGWRQVRHAD
ncbi:hypothetical protein [Streptomyces griseomycini]|uniref:Uncharacterized protein n=1 Tax=Streptomyces griseomycini TaxID=66895 RepID=A0A7W7VAI5_9ACTN|nr:hypothetical protein [Streptomyces griseomycini]MBB4903031.1 hypothetical protein [Streptomyces griseomycini]GGR50650.1 hypothetical protein GCM10015536_65250 [Streptomyces griseomycini]